MSQDGKLAGLGGIYQLSSGFAVITDTAVSNYEANDNEKNHGSDYHIISPLLFMDFII